MSKFIDISLVKENPDNPRSISDEQFEKLIDSIKKFPEMLKLRPIVVNKEMIVLGGNMRLRACIKAGLTHVPVTIVNLTEAQEQEFIIRDNINYGDWDILKLKDDNRDASQLKDWGIDLSNLKENFKPERMPTKNIATDVLISCKNEREQKRIFEELEKRGFKCKLLT